MSNHDLLKVKSVDVKALLSLRNYNGVAATLEKVLYVLSQHNQPPIDVSKSHSNIYVGDVRHGD